jgi:hypothetical protein
MFLFGGLRLYRKMFRVIDREALFFFVRAWRGRAA